MLFLAISWILLLAVSFEVGSTVLDLSKETTFRRLGDRFVISAWLGILVLANLLLAISIISRLSLLILLLLCVGLIFISGLLSGRLHLEMLRPYLSSGLILGFITLLIATSYVTTQVVTWYDTGGYHFGIIKWLSRYGTVPGIALVYYAFGYTSSWFALAASFNDWIFDARAGALTGGFAFLMLILHLWLCVVRVFGDRSKAEDWFIIISSLLALAVITRYEIHVSPSQDLPVIILVIVTAWTILVSARARSHEGIIPILLSAGAISTKVSALPIWLASGCFYLCLKKVTIRRALNLAGITLLILCPFLTSQVITSGCLSYPSSLMCFDLPWTVGAEKTKEVVEQILKAAQWSTITPPQENSWSWVLQWIIVEKYQTVLILLTIFCFLFFSSKLTGDYLHWSKWPLVMGIIGITYVMLLGPTWRYSLGYLVIIPGVFLSLTHERKDAAVQLGLCHLRRIIPLKLTPAVPLFGVSVIIPLLSLMVNNLEAFNFLRMEIKEAVSEGHIVTPVYDPSRLLLPPKILNFSLGVDSSGGKLSFTVVDLELTQRKTNDVLYYKPKSGYQCWDVELPCSQFLTYENIRLRDPQSGIGKGFARVE